jgi:hypothetical protein
MAFIKQRVAMRPFNYILFSSTAAGFITALAWMLVTWAVEGLPGKLVIEGKTVSQSLKKQLLERFLGGFLGGFAVNTIMHMVAEDPVPQAVEVQQDLKIAAYKNAHPCAAVSQSPCELAKAALANAPAAPACGVKRE